MPSVSNASPALYSVLAFSTSIFSIVLLPTFAMLTLPKEATLSPSSEQPMLMPIPTNFVQSNHFDGAAFPHVVLALHSTLKSVNAIE